MPKEITYEILEGGPPTHHGCGKPYHLIPFYPDDLGGELYCPDCEPKKKRLHKMRLKRWAKSGEMTIQ